MGKEGHYIKDLLGINLLGCVKVPVFFKGTEEVLTLYIDQNGGPPLLGRKWMNALCGKQ